MAVRPHEKEDADLRDRQAQITAYVLEALLRCKARVEQVEEPRGEREEQQQARDAVKDRDPTRQWQADFEQERREAEVFRTCSFGCRARHERSPDPSSGQYRL